MTCFQHLRTLLAYRDLLMVFVWREFSIRYRQSVLGILWALFQPLSMMLLFTFVFTAVMPVPITSSPYPLFFLAALLPWNFFASAVNAAIPTLTGHYNLITKIYFPREILPLAGLALALLDLCISMLLFIVLFIYYGVPLTWASLWFFPLVLLLLFFTVAVALIGSSLNVYYRDVNLLMNFLMQLWFFLTPVLYTVDRVSPRLKVLLFCNPLTFIVENMRRCLIEGRPVIWWQYLIMLCFVLAISYASVLLFKNMERKFADVI